MTSRRALFSILPICVVGFFGASCDSSETSPTPNAINTSSASSASELCGQSSVAGNSPYLLDMSEVQEISGTAVMTFSGGERALDPSNCASSRDLSLIKSCSPNEFPWTGVTGDVKPLFSVGVKSLTTADYTVSSGNSDRVLSQVLLQGNDAAAQKFTSKVRDCKYPESAGTLSKQYVIQSEADKKLEVVLIGENLVTDLQFSPTWANDSIEKIILAVDQKMSTSPAQ